MALPLPDWSYLRNVFDNVTDSNFKRMQSLSRDHNDKLFANSATNPDINNLYLLMNPAYIDFSNKFVAVNSNFGAYKSATKTFEGIISDLNKKIKTWDIQIQNVYADDTAEYTLLLPSGRKPFQSGTYEQRYSALSTLASSLGGFPLLATILTDVQAFALQFNTARTAQQVCELKDTQFRVALEESRERLAVVMHRIFGMLIFLYSDTPAIIESYYELQYLKAPKPPADAPKPIEIPANSRLQVLEESVYLETDTFEIENTGQTPIGFFITETETAPTPDDLTIVQSGKKQNFTGSELSDGNPLRLFIAVNLTNVKGKILVAQVQTE